MSNYAERFRQRSRQSGRNMHESKGGATLIPAGSGMFRLVGAVEIGKQLTTFNRNVITRAQIMLTWELSGPKWQPENGRNITKTIRYTNSDSSKSELFKMFELMDPDHKYSRIGEMIGEVFLGECFHKKGSGQNAKTYANFRGIKSPIIEDPATGEVKDYSTAAAPLSNNLMGFMWDDPTLEDWDNLFIDGKWDDGGSRNVFQQAIRAAEDFEGSPIWDVLEADDRDPYADYGPKGEAEVNGSSAANRKEIKAQKDRIRNGTAASEDGGEDEAEKPPARERSRRRADPEESAPPPRRAAATAGW